MTKPKAQKFAEFVAYSVIAVGLILLLALASALSWWAWTTALGLR